MRLIRKARREWFGGVVYSEHPGFTAFVDDRRADSLGIPRTGHLPQGLFSAPLDVHLAVTNRCNLRCAGCYARRKDEPEMDVSFETARRIIDHLAGWGVFTVALGGGEPLLHPRVFDIARHARNRQIVPNITTNGILIDAATAPECRVFGSLHLSCHDASELDRLAEAAAHLRTRRIRPGLNLLVSARTLDALPDIARWCSRQGITRVLFLKFKLTENNREDAALALSPEQERDLIRAIRRLCRRHGLMPMLDCSLFPALACHAPRKRDLEFFDVNGCQGANAYLAVDVDGQFKPCSFCPSGMGPLTALDRNAWIGDGRLNAFRNERPHARCSACHYGDLCNGGCRIGGAPACLSPPERPSSH